MGARGTWAGVALQTGQAGIVPRLGLSPLELSGSFPWLPELGSPTDLCQGKGVGDPGDTEGATGLVIVPCGGSAGTHAPWHGVPWSGIVWYGTAWHTRPRGHSGWGFRSVRTEIK